MPRAALAAALLGLALLGALVVLFARDRAAPEPDEQLRRAMDHLALVGTALERQRVIDGDWPRGLATLVPGQLPSLPPDPFGAELQLGVGPGGERVLYSVGPDRVDQGGLPFDEVTGRGDLVYPLD